MSRRAFLLIAACAIVVTARADVFPVYNYVVIDESSKCGDACPTLIPNSTCAFGVNVRSVDVANTFGCYGPNAADCVGVSSCATTSVNQLCTCFIKNIAIDLSADDTKTVSVTGLVFNVSSISDSCTSLHNVQVGEDLKQMGIVALCDPSNYVIDSLSSCGILQNKGMYVSFTTNATVSSTYIMEHVIRSAFIRRTGSSAIAVSICYQCMDTVTQENSTSGTATVFLYQFPNDPMDIVRSFNNVQGTSMSADTAPFDNSQYPYDSLAVPLHTEIIIGDLFTKIMLISDMQTYSATSGFNPIESIFEGVNDTTISQFGPMGVEHEYPLMRLSTAFQSFESGSCRAVYDPTNSENWPLSQDIFSLSALQTLAASLNKTELYSRFSTDPAYASTSARNSIATDTSTFIETFFKSVDYAVLSSLALSMNMSINTIYMFNTTDVSKFSNVHPILDNLVTVSTADASVQGGLTGIKAVSGVVGTPSAGYILRAPVTTCTADTVTNTLASIKAAKSPASVGWIGVAACWPPAAKAAASESFLKKYFIPLACAAGGLAALVIIVFLACACWGKKRTVPAVKTIKHAEEAGAAAEEGSEYRMARKRAALKLR